MALNFRIRVDAKDHNNIKINPVFRGMPRSFWGFERAQVQGKRGRLKAGVPLKL
jgi:hypothetical protein